MLPAILRRSLSRRAIVAGVVVLMALSAGVSWEMFHARDIELDVATASARRPLVVINGTVKQMPPGDYLSGDSLVDTTGCSSTNVIAWNGTQFACAAGGGGGSATFTSVTVNTNGQAALISTYVGSASDGSNVWIGGGGQLSSGSGADPDWGAHNVSVGVGALASCTHCSESVAVGEQALTASTTPNDDVAIGAFALKSDVDGIDDIAIGAHALEFTIGTDPAHGSNNGVDNIAIGSYAMQNNFNGEQNIAIGDRSLMAQVNQRNNIAIGLNALNAATADSNIAVGTNAMQLTTTGDSNIAIGPVSLLSNTSGASNIAIGRSAMISNLTGSYNIAIGMNSLEDATQIQNIALGFGALPHCTGYQNVGIGASTGQNLVGGIANTFVGDTTGVGITTGGGNSIFGAEVHGLAAGTTNKVILADGTGTSTDQIWLSPPAPTSVNHGSLGTGSSNTVGNITGVGSFTSVTLTYSNSGFPNRSWCQATPNGHSVSGQYIEVTNSATAPVFSCFTVTTAAAANCDDFTYWCTGQ